MNASTTPNPQYAQALARHVKAALLHLRQAEDLAELAGVDLDASAHDVPEAGLIRAAGEAVEDLDMWAVNYARMAGAAPAVTYQHTERWCQAEGGHLPAGSWPSDPAEPAHVEPGDDYPWTGTDRDRVAHLFPNPADQAFLGLIPQSSAASEPDPEAGQ
jgi:hypothetical protein